jgi:hypothetical protein
MTPAVACRADKFPQKVSTDAFPPLAKFSAPFGIIDCRRNRFSRSRFATSRRR